MKFADGRSLTDAVRSRDNLFDLLRVSSAFAVIFSHSFSLTGRAEPIGTATGFEVATLGVFALFAISGFLLAAGWEGGQDTRAYWIKRALRILPGLIVSSLLTALVLGPLLSDLSLSSYFSAGAPYLYVVKHAVLDTFSAYLPGVFTHNPYPRTVNGSLWTIPVEVCCYFALFLAARWAALPRPRLLLVILIGVCAAMIVGHPPDAPTGKAAGTVTELLGGLRLCGVFLCGTLLWVERDRIRFNPTFVAVSIVLVFIPWPSGLHSVIDILLVPYVVVAIGSQRRGRLAFLTAAGDVTYGVYIYSYPLQQSLAHVISGLSPLEMMAISYPVSWGCGILSWRLLERPAMSLRGRLGARPRPDAEPASEHPHVLAADGAATLSSPPPDAQSAPGTNTLTP